MLCKKNTEGRYSYLTAAADRIITMRQLWSSCRQGTFCHQTGTYSHYDDESAMATRSCAATAYEVMYSTSKHCTFPLALSGLQAPMAMLKVWIAYSVSSQTNVTPASHTDLAGSTADMAKAFLPSIYNAITDSTTIWNCKLHFRGRAQDALASCSAVGNVPHQPSIHSTVCKASFIAIVGRSHKVQAALRAQQRRCF